MSTKHRNLPKYRESAWNFLILKIKDILDRFPLLLLLPILDYGIWDGDSLSRIFVILPRNSKSFSADFIVFLKSVLHMNHPQITEIGTGLQTGSRPGEWPLSP